MLRLRSRFEFWNTSFRGLCYQNRMRFNCALFAFVSTNTSECVFAQGVLKSGTAELTIAHTHRFWTTNTTSCCINSAATAAVRLPKRHLSWESKWDLRRNVASDELLVCHFWVSHTFCHHFDVLRFPRNSSSTSSFYLFKKLDFYKYAVWLFNQIHAIENISVKGNSFEKSLSFQSNIRRNAFFEKSSFH